VGNGKDILKMVTAKRALTPKQYFMKAALRQLPNITMGPAVPKTGFPRSDMPGDDGSLMLGAPLSGPRFTNLGDGTVLDCVTGRMWVADPRALGPPFYIGGEIQAMHWEDAITACNNLVYAGHDDWKLPNIKELGSLFYIMLNGYQINTDFFTIYDWYYWSSTSYVENPIAAWVKEFVYGLNYSMNKEAYEFLVLPCRGMPKLV
jgi:hypothetical protein